MRADGTILADWAISIVGHIAVDCAVGSSRLPAAARRRARSRTTCRSISSPIPLPRQVTRGEKTAEKVEAPTPLAEKVDEAKPVEDPTAKIVEKKEVKAATRDAAHARGQAGEAKPAEAKPVEAKPDPIAEALAKDAGQEAGAEKGGGQAAPTPPKKPAPPAPKFDPKKVEALLDKRDSTRLAAAGPVPNSAASLGTPTGKATQLSLSELDALRQRLAQLWSIPAGARDPQELVVVFRIKLKRDGTLDGWPTLVSSGKTPLSLAARESAARALNRGQPYDMLRPENYELWKDIEITFDPRDMIRQ